MSRRNRTMASSVAAGSAVFVLAGVLVAVAAGAQPGPRPTRPRARGTDASVPPPDASGAICEPGSNCGFWSGCLLLTPASGGGYEITGAIDGRGLSRSYRRQHQCGHDGRCNAYCSGHGAARRCVDGLVGTNAACDGTGPPSPAPIECALVAGQCVPVR